MNRLQRCICYVRQEMQKKHLRWIWYTVLSNATQKVGNSTTICDCFISCIYTIGKMYFCSWTKNLNWRGHSPCALHWLSIQRRVFFVQKILHGFKPIRQMNSNAYRTDYLSMFLSTFCARLLTVTAFVFSILLGNFFTCDKRFFSKSLQQQRYYSIRFIWT